MIRALIICPQQVRLNWQREFDKFATCKGKVSIMRGDLHDRVRKIAEMINAEDGLQFSATICAYDSYVRTSTYIGLVEWDIVVTDECHYYKDPRTNRWQEIRNCQAKYKVAMSGSPIGNSPMDLWSQLEFLGDGFSGFRSYKAFRKFHGIYEKVQQTGAHGVEKLVGVKNIPLLQERLARLSFAVTKAEAGLSLPDKTYSIYEVQMEPYQAKCYAKLQDQLALEIEDKMSGEIVDEVTIKNILTQLLRLAQITSGYITYDEKRDELGNVLAERRTEELCPVNPKFEAIKDLLTEDRDPRAKTVIWCTFKHNIHRISRGLTELGILHGCYHGDVPLDERDRLVDEFNNNPNFKVLVCNPQTAGEGLNLLGYNLKNPELTDTFCDMEIFFSINWSAIGRAQAEDRIHRRGTRMPVQVIDLIVPGSIDEEIHSNVTEKRKMAATVADLKSTLTKVLRNGVVNDS
jgi:SNF2 family DNA or RNA helicase